MNEINRRLYQDPEWNRREQMAKALFQRRMIASSALAIPFIVPIIIAVISFGA